MARLFDNTHPVFAQTDNMDVGWEKNLHNRKRALINTFTN